MLPGSRMRRRAAALPGNAGSAEPGRAVTQRRGRGGAGWAAGSPPRGAQELGTVGVYCLLSGGRPRAALRCRLAHPAGSVRGPTAGSPEGLGSFHLGSGKALNLLRVLG